MDLKQKISSSLALILIFLLSFLVAWFALAVGDKVIKNSLESKAFNPEQRF
jgi:hypothetical protein